MACTDCTDTVNALREVIVMLTAQRDQLFKKVTEGAQYTFTELTMGSHRGLVSQFLKELAFSPFAYHIDDPLGDIVWSGTAPTADQYNRIANNMAVLWEMHKSCVLSWNEIWSIYGAHWDEADKAKKHV